MKSLLQLNIFLLIMVNSLSTVGQTLLLDENQKYTVQGIMQVDSIPAELIMQKTNGWIGETFRSPKDAVAHNDVANRMIIINGSYKTNLFMKEGFIEFRLTLEFKDGKLRYTFTNFSYFSTGSGSMAFESSQMGFKKKIFTETESNIQSSLSSLKSYLKFNNPKKDDW